MDALFSQLSSQESKALFQELGGKQIILWIWEKGESTKKIPINSVLNKDFSLNSHDELIPQSMKRASLLGTFEYQGFYYFLKLLSRDLNNEVQFLCDPIIHKNERRKRKRFQISPKSKEFIVVIPLTEAPPIIQSSGNVFSLFPVKILKNFLSHLTSVSEGRPLYHLSFSLFDISTSGLSMIADSVETEYLNSIQKFPEASLILNKDKLVIKNLEIVHRSSFNVETKEIQGGPKKDYFRLGVKFVCDDWTAKKIQHLLEMERENVVKEFDQWSKN